MSSEIKDALRRLGGPAAVAIVSGTVTAVRPEAEECDVVLDDEGPELPDVALLSGIYPAVGSPVLVGLVEGQFTDAFLLTCDEPERIDVQVGTVRLRVTGQGITLNGDALGGLVKAGELRAQLDKSNAVLEAIRRTLTTWVPVPGDGGAALKTAVTAALAGKALGNFSDLQNPTVKHG